MANWFVEALHKVTDGAKFLVEHVWQGLKSAFGKKAYDISLAAVKSAKELLATEAGQFIHKVVEELESSAFEGPERLKVATDNVKSYLIDQGKQMPTIWIQWAIQTILLFIRGLAEAENPQA